MTCFGMEILSYSPSLASSEPDREHESDSSAQSSASDTRSTSTDFTHQASRVSMQCDASPTTLERSVVQRGGEHEDANDALDLHDRRLDATGSLQNHGGGSIEKFHEQPGTNSSRENVPPLLNDHVDLEKGLNGADAEQIGLELGQGSGENAEEDKCRVCHMAFDNESAAGEAMELGCNCKDDLSLAHRDCAEAWFKIKGDRTCEICSATVHNIVGTEDTNFMDQWNDRDVSTSLAEPPTRCWQSLSVCNFFLACMVVTFILLWLFRVTIS